MKTNIYGVYFICCQGIYQEIIKEQLASLQNSRLLDKTKLLLCFICDFKVEVMKLFEPIKSKVLFIVTKENLYERFALEHFRHYINSDNHPYYLYYFHTKGVSRTPHAHFHNIRRNLDYIIIEKHELCIRALDRGYDVVGTALSRYPSLHFSGNFWWATSHYLARLPTEIYPWYYASEMYICCDPNGKFLSLCQDTNHVSNQELRARKDEYLLHHSTSTPIDNIWDRLYHEPQSTAKPS